MYVRTQSQKAMQFAVSLASRENVLLGGEVLSYNGRHLLELPQVVLQKHLVVVAQVTHQVLGDVIAVHLLSEPGHQDLSLLSHLIHLFLGYQGLIQCNLFPNAVYIIN